MRHWILTDTLSLATCPLYSDMWLGAIVYSPYDDEVLTVARFSYGKNYCLNSDSVDSDKATLEGYFDTFKTDAEAKEIIKSWYPARTPVFTLQPVDSAIVGGIASFSVLATNAQTYQWQCDFGVDEWEDIEDNTTYTGTATKDLVVTYNDTLEGFNFRCVAGNKIGSVASDTAKVISVPDIYTNELYVEVGSQIIEPSYTNEIYVEVGNLVVDNTYTNEIYAEVGELGE